MSNQTTIHVTKYETVEVRFDGFEGLPAVKGVDFVYSPTFTCFGHKWCLRLFPGGAPTSDDGKVSISLQHMSVSEGNIKVQASFFVKESAGKIAAYTRLTENDFHSNGAPASSWGNSNFAERSMIQNALQDDGSLVIEARMMQSKPGIASPDLPTYLENPLYKNILKKFMDEESADIVFEVSSEKIVTAEHKIPKTELSPFPAHRLILQDSAPYLFDICTSGEDSDTIPITDVRPEIFHHMLYYIYGGKLSDDDLKANAMAIIDVADRYEVVNLKLEAEAILVSSTTITIDNVMELLLYADEKNCALLKEAAMDFLVRNRGEARNAVSFDNAPGHLMKDLLLAMDSDDNTRINTLRGKLHEKGLAIDGSREAMIALLEETS